MEVFFQSELNKYKTPFGCVRQDESCHIMVEVLNVEETTISLVIEDDMGHERYNFIMKRVDHIDSELQCYECSFSLSECGLYYYYFRIDEEKEQLFVFKNEDGAQINSGGKWQLTCYAKDYDTPSEFKGKVMYQIFPDRFYQSGVCDLSEKLQPYILKTWGEVPEYRADEKGVVQNNDFFGGNLKGIIKKLPYLQGLGVQIIYLNPIFKAFSNHRYDTCDYKKVDPLLGTEEDFKLLCTLAHQLDIKIILDGVFSHTGERSVYFDKYKEHSDMGAYDKPMSPYRSWFQFDEHEPNGYRCWWGINTLPCTQEMDPSFVDFIIEGKDSVVEHWLRLGADGFRLDVADELPDEFIEKLYKRVKQLKPNAFVLGEVWEDASYKISYSVRRHYFTNQEMDATMNYPYKDAIIHFVQEKESAKDFAKAIMSIAENYPKPVLDCVMNSLSTHDTMRILTVLGVDKPPSKRSERAAFQMSQEEYERGKKKLKLAAFLQFVLPGCPCIYYGDEIGMQGFEDPFNRSCFTWENQDQDLLKYYWELSELKRSHPALQTGDIQVLFSENGVCCFSRKTEEEHLIFIASVRKQYDCFLGERVKIMEQGHFRDGWLRIKQYGFVLFEIKEKEGSFLGSSLRDFHNSNF